MDMYAVIPPSGLPAISPSRGEIGKAWEHCSTATIELGETALHPVSPPEGEMAGRPERGERRPEAIR